MAHRACGDDFRLNPDTKFPVRDVSYPHAWNGCLRVSRLTQPTPAIITRIEITYSKEQLLRAGPRGFLVFQSFFTNVHLADLAIHLGAGKHNSKAAEYAAIIIVRVQVDVIMMFSLGSSTRWLKS